MPSTLQVAAEFLLQSLFGLYILTFMLRFLFQCARVDFYNPLAQFLVKVTNPLLAPMRRVIPGLFGLDMAAIVVMLILQMAEIYIVGSRTIHFHIEGLLYGQFPPFLTALILAISSLFTIAIYVYMIALIIQAVISWVNPGSYNPISSLLYGLNEPLLRPVRRILPPIGGLDLSPLVIILLLNVLQIIITPNLHVLAYQFYR